MHLGHAWSAKPTRKAFTFLKSRFVKASVRSRKVARLARRATMATKLFVSGVHPMAVCGSSTVGLNMSLQKRLDYVAFQSCGALGQMACQTTAVILRLGHLPSIKQLVAVIRRRIFFWKELGDDGRMRVRMAWVKLRQESEKLPTSRVWTIVSCPLSASIAVLRTAGWHPSCEDVFHTKGYEKPASISPLTP